jgi:hypothetical protein
LWRNFFSTRHPHQRAIRYATLSFVVTRLHGGLGNQFFQYAAGRALALRYGAALKLDIGIFVEYTLRRYELDKYPIQATIATEEELSAFAHEPQKGRVGRLIDTISGRSRPTRYREPKCFDPALFGLSVPIHLTGYWQSERYFQHISETIRRELTPVAPLDADNERALTDILRSSSIAVHVRRGDYLKSAVHGTLPVGYYRRAMDYMASRVSKPVFYVFSDEPSWVHENLHHPAPLVQMNINGPERGFRDIQLMSACQYHILANSSFSWWGAWMNTSSEKIVIAPKPWYLRKQIETPDLFPEGWVAIPTYDLYDNREREGGA